MAPRLHRALLNIGDTCRFFKEAEKGPRDELEAYKQTPNPEKAVIRYLEGKIRKAEKKTKEWEDAYAHRKEDIAEYQKAMRQKTKPIPTWIVEEYERHQAIKERNATKTSRP